MSRSRLPLLLALLASVPLVVGGCASRRWPRVQPVVDPSFKAGTRSVTIVDVLPMDVELAAHPRSGLGVDDVAARFDASAQGAVVAALARRGYRVGAVIDWEGGIRGAGMAQGGEAPAPVIPRPALHATLDVLAVYGQVAAQNRGRTIAARLPAPLGTATGAEATLYVGGYAYAGDDDRVTGSDVAKIVVVAAAIVVILAIVLIAAKSGAGKGKGKGPSFGGGGRGGGRVLVGHLGGRSRHALGAGGRIGFPGGGRFFRATYHAVDAFGRTAEVLPPDRQVARPAVPRRGRSQLLLEMTLVENRTGRILWHASQRFRANPASNADVNQAIGRMLATLP